MIITDNEFLESILPEPVRLLGQDLHPFSIGHAIWLNRLEIHKIQTFEELMTAVYVCAHTWDEIPKAFASRFLKLKITLWKLRLLRANFLWSRVAFLRYSKINCPPYFDDAGSTSRPGTPFLQHLRFILLSKIKYPMDSVMDTGINMALWDYYTLAELNGMISIIPPEERIQPDEMEQEEEVAFHKNTIAQANVILKRKPH